MNPDELLSHASQFDFEFERIQLPHKYKDYLVIKLRFDEDENKEWIVCNHGSCWDSEIKRFIYEPSPSNRTDEFLKNTRFSLKEALEIVEELSKKGDW